MTENQEREPKICPVCLVFSKDNELRRLHRDYREQEQWRELVNFWAWDIEEGLLRYPKTL